jgi:hypothetical protein
MTAQEKVDRILAELKAGKTITAATHLKAIRFTQKHVDRFQAAGMPLLKASNDHIYIASGKKYVCATYCKWLVDA